MGELTAIELRTLASHQHYDGPLRQALQWAADRIDYLEGYIDGYEREQTEQRHKALDQLTAEAQAMGFYGDKLCAAAGNAAEPPKETSNG